MIVYYHCKEGMRDSFLKAIKEARISELCKQEAGNRQYDYFLPTEDTKTVLLLEKWDTEEAQKAHLTTPHFKLLGELKAQYVEQVEIERHLTD